MTTQRTINLHSAPMSAGLRAFWRAAGTGMATSSRPESRLNLLGMSCANRGSSYGMNGTNGTNGIKRRHGNSAPLRGSA